MNKNIAIKYSNSNYSSLIRLVSLKVYEVFKSVLSWIYGSCKISQEELLNIIIYGIYLAVCVLNPIESGLMI